MTHGAEEVTTRIAVANHERPQSASWNRDPRSLQFTSDGTHRKTKLTVGTVCDSVCTTDDGKHRKRPHSSLGQQQNQYKIVEREKRYAHSDVFQKQIALLEARTAFRAATRPRPERIDHNRQEASVYRKQPMRHLA